MGMYTELDLKVRFKKEDAEDLKLFIETFNEYLFSGGSFNKEEFSKLKNKLVSINKVFKELVDDYRWGLLRYRVSENDEFLDIEIEGDIKNYTDTYEKLYKVLLSFNPESGSAEELYEEYNSPDIYEFEDGKMILTKQHTQEF